MAKRTVSPKLGVIKAPVITDEKVVVVHHCTQAGVIGEMSGLLKLISDQIYDNGEKGLAITVPALGTKIVEMSLKIDDLRTTVSGLVKYISEDTGEKRAIEKQKLSTRQWTEITIASIIAVAGIVVTIILKT